MHANYFQISQFGLFIQVLIINFQLVGPQKPMEEARNGGENYESNTHFNY